MRNLRTIIVTLAACSRRPLSGRADGGTVRISFLKAGWVIGGTVGRARSRSAGAPIRCRSAA